MKKGLSRAKQFWVVAGCTALLAFVADVQPQGIKAVAAAAKPASDAETNIKMLRKQLSDLEQRIVELEKEKLELAKEPEPPTEGAGSNKALEQRIAGLEKAAAESKAERQSGVRAPFVVHDDAGHTIFRVEGAGGSRVAAIIGNPLGASVKLGVTSEGNGTVRLTNPSGQEQVSLNALSKGGVLGVAAEGGIRAQMDAAGVSGAVTVFNSSGTPAASIESGKGGAGHMFIANSAGNIAIDAGVLKDGIGIIKTGPGGHGPAGVVAGSPLAASSIQGKK